MSVELTSKEKKAIARLQKVFYTWPKSLCLFSNGTMFVLKTGKDGKRVMKGDGVDGDYVVGTISNVHSDGGDW